MCTSRITLYRQNLTAYMVEVHAKSELLVYSSPLMLLVMKGNCGAIFYCIDQRTRTIIEPVINRITSDLAAMLRLNNDVIDTKFKITIAW